MSEKHSTGAGTLYSKEISQSASVCDDGLQGHLDEVSGFAC